MITVKIIDKTHEATHVYKGTKQEGKADILFYLDAED